jgi:hypothetical protein
VKSSLLDVGKILFPDAIQAWETFYGSFISDRKIFISQNSQLLSSYDNFDLSNLKPIEVLYIFGDSKGLITVTDWRGEENENEIEESLNKVLKQNYTWTNALKTREGLKENQQRDGKFVIELLKSIDKDLQTTGHRLIFLQLGWDAYVFMPVGASVFNEVISKSPGEFYGVEKL